MKVYTYQNYATHSYDIYFADERHGKRYIAKPMKLDFEEIIEGQESFPSLRIPIEIMEALAEALDQQGIKTDNDHKIKGLLEAKESHLQDMRKLVFKVNHKG